MFSFLSREWLSRGGASVGAEGLKPSYPEELHWKQRGRIRRREGKGARRRGRKRNEPPLRDAAGFATVAKRKN